MQRTYFRAGLLAWALLAAACGPQPASREQIAAYSEKITFSDFTAEAAENIAGHTIYQIGAQVRNQGNRTIAEMDVVAAFRDDDRQVVLKEAAPVVRRTHMPLKAGESRRVELRFESLPKSWNRHAPELQVTRLVLE